MSIPNQQNNEKPVSSLSPIYSLNFLKAAKESNYFIIPSPSPAFESASLINNNKNNTAAPTNTNTYISNESNNPTIPSTLKLSSSSNSSSSPINTLDDYNSKILFTYPEPISAYRTSTNSLIASVFAVAFGFPLDSVKTRLQTYKYKGTWSCIVDTYKTEGVLGFYRGLMAPLVCTD